MAPEVISRNNVQYGPQVDVYSFAMVMYQVLFEVVPFARDHCNMLLLAHEILNGKRPSIPFVDSKADISTCKIDRIPFDESKLEAWCSHALHPVPTRIMKSLTKVMVACWHTDPSLRPTFDGVLLLLGEATNEPIVTLERFREMEQLLREKEHEIQMKDKRIADVEEELTIVKKAVHIFSKPRN